MCSRTALAVSDCENLHQGYRLCRKDGAAEVEWDTNEDVNEDSNTFAIGIKKSAPNSYAVHSWRIDCNIL